MMRRWIAICWLAAFGCGASLPDSPSKSVVAPVETATLKQANARTKINLNTATVEQLASLPGVGAGYAARIIEHRERYGRFRRVEHLMLVKGFSEKRFESLRELVTVE